MIESDKKLMYWLQSACKVIVKGSHYIMPGLTNDYGLPDKLEGSLLRIWAYSAFVFEFASLPYLDKQSSRFASSALEFIGRAIDKADSEPEFMELTSISEVYGSDLTKYEELFTIPGNRLPTDGRRAEYMTSDLNEYEAGAETAMMRLEPGDPELALKEVGRVADQYLSRWLYYTKTVENDLFVTNYLLFQKIIDGQYRQSKKIL